MKINWDTVLAWVLGLTFVFPVIPAAIFGGYYLIAGNNKESTPVIRTVDEDSTQTTESQSTGIDYDADTYEEIHGDSDCTSDCSGHDAGYEWARDNDVCDPYFDAGNSESFAEGVVAYAYDNCYYSRDGEPI